MRHRLTLTAVICVFGIASAEALADEKPLRDRHEFAAAMSKVEGSSEQSDQPTTKERILELLGKPDDVRTQNDAGGIATNRTLEIWRYGTNGHLTTATLGSILIDEDGNAQRVYGRGAPPRKEMFTEPELRNWIRLIDNGPSRAGSGFNPADLIRVVNALQPLGKDKALALLAEYLRVTGEYDGDPAARGGVFLVLRALFEVPKAPLKFPKMEERALFEIGALTRFPIHIESNVPIMLGSLGGGSGPGADPESHVEWFIKHGELRMRPIRPLDNPLDVYEKVLATAKIPATDAWTPEMIMEQLLRMVDSVYRPAKTGDRFFEFGQGEKRFPEMRAEFAKLNVHWDVAKNQYVFADGTTLPDRIKKLYRREIWQPDIAGRDEQIAVERLDDERVLINATWRTDLKARQPPMTIQLYAWNKADPKRRKSVARIECDQPLFPGKPPTDTFGSNTQREAKIPAGWIVELELTSGEVVKKGEAWVP